MHISDREFHSFSGKERMAERSGMEQARTIRTEKEYPKNIVYSGGRIKDLVC